MNAEKLTLWGTSLAGGHVLVMAAEMGQAVKAVVSQASSWQGGRPGGGGQAWGRQ